MASRNGRGGAPQRDFRSCRRSERGGGGAGLRARSGGPGPRRAPVVVGPGQGGAAAGRAALSPRTSRSAAPSPDPCRRQHPRGCAVRAGGGAALPRSCVRGGRDRGQSACIGAYRLAPAEPGRGKTRHPAVADPARCRPRSGLGADALGNAVGTVATPALEPRRAGHPVVERGTFPRPHPSTRPLDSAR